MRGTVVSIRAFKDVKLADCLNAWLPRESGLVWDECIGGGRRKADGGCDCWEGVGEADSSKAWSMPRASNGAPASSSELRSFSDRRALCRRDWDEL
jgi:hypothetical protein